MKGTYFQKPLQYSLNVDGESWHQDQEITGQFNIKNMGADVVELKMPRVILAYGDFSAVKQKSPDAFEAVTNVVTEKPKKLDPQKDISFSWKVKLDRNAAITDKSSSLFLLYGSDEVIEKLGHLQLIVHPEPVIGELLKTWTTQFRFVLKNQKANKGFVEVKFAPPDGRVWATIEQMLAQFRYDKDNLETKYTFSVKKIDASVGNMELKKSKMEFKQAFQPTQYKTSAGRYHHEEMEKSAQSILDQLGLGKVL
jgi:hypothetical protein